MLEPPRSPKHISPLDRYTPPQLPAEDAGAGDHPIIREVMAGKRYVTYPYVVSILVMSFRRTMGGVRVVETGAWPVGPLFGAALVSGFFGWWGFPWGLVWTPLILHNLWRGGRDATREILTNIVGAPEAKRILKIAPKPKPPGAIWLVRLFLLIPLALVALLVFAIATSPPPP
jgi:hypothetical protein